MKYTKWENVCVRWDYCGKAYLLQKRICEETGEIQFVNRLIDKPRFFGSLLFHRSENTLPDLLKNEV